jgi:hypothetical protein
MEQREIVGTWVIMVMLIVLLFACVSCSDESENCNWKAYNSVMDMYRSQYNYQETLGIAYQTPGKPKPYYDSIAKISLRISEHQRILYDSMRYFCNNGCPKSKRHYIAPE